MCKITDQIPQSKAATAVKAGSPQRRNRHGRRVRFGTVSAKLFHQPLTKSDKKSIWYSGSDYKAMNKEVHRNLKRELLWDCYPQEQGPPQPNCWRGLEHVREGLPNIKLERRRHFVRTLLHAHKTMGVKDPVELSHLAIAQSNVDQIRAQYFAEYDAYEASCVYNEGYYQKGYYGGEDYYDQQPWGVGCSPSGSFDSTTSSVPSLQEEEPAEFYYKEFSPIPQKSNCPRLAETIIMARPM